MSQLRLAKTALVFWQELLLDIFHKSPGERGGWGCVVAAMLLIVVATVYVFFLWSFLLGVSIFFGDPEDWRVI